MRSILTAQGGVTHVVLGGDDRIGHEAWLHTEADLAAIAPPLTRILNRYPATQAAAAGGDFFALGFGAIGYGTRSMLQTRAYQAALAAQGPEPVPGAAPADPGSGPTTDDDLPGIPFTPAQP